MARISISDLQVFYQGASASALTIPSLEVDNGEILAVVGVSGSGKTTLLRAIAGFVRQRANGTSLLGWIVSESADGSVAGTIAFDGRDVTTLAPRDRCVAFAAQSLNLYPHLKARDNLAFPARMQGAMSDREIDGRVHEVAKLLSIDKLLDRTPGQLSGGEQQRVALGKALVRSANVCLLDEPMSSIDAPHRSELRHILRRHLRDRHQTTLYVTHDLDEAFAVGDRVAVVDRGRLQQVDEPSDLYRQPKSLDVARIVWAGRMCGLSGTCCMSDGVPSVRVGEVALPVGQNESWAPDRRVWLAAPRESLVALPAGAGGLEGTIVDVRFEGGTRLVEVEGKGFGVIVEAGDGVDPRAGTRVSVRVSFEALRVFTEPGQNNR